LNQEGKEAKEEKGPGKRALKYKNERGKKLGLLLVALANRSEVRSTKGGLTKKRRKESSKLVEGEGFLPILSISSKGKEELGLSDAGRWSRERWSLEKRKKGAALFLALQGREYRPKREGIEGGREKTAEGPILGGGP